MRKSWFSNSLKCPQLTGKDFIRGVEESAVHGSICRKIQKGK